jgi:penicillin V acylase-like amidase (Ntn superfamily)
MKKAMKWFIVNLVIIYLFPAGITSQMYQSGFSCSTFMLKHGSEQIFGHNLDMQMVIKGVVVVNKRNVYKTGRSWDELTSSEKRKTPEITWTSKYGSITVNPITREFPDGGMNEAGLCIWEMSLGKTKFVENDSHPKLFMAQWMQYVLDNFESADQVIKSASEITLDGWGWHFFTGDRDGRCAAIEFIDGEPAVHSGESLPVTALMNTEYSQELDTLKTYEGFGGDKKIPISDKTDINSRFVKAAYMLKNYKNSVSPNIIDYGFDILRQVEAVIDQTKWTQWSIVCDIKRLKVYFRTSVGKDIRYVSFDSFDFSNESPVKILDINADLSGNVAEKFKDYTLSANSAEQFVELMNRDPNFEQWLVSRGITSITLRDRLENYAETTINK